MVSTICTSDEMHCYENRLFVGNWVETMKVAMAFLTDIDTGLPRAPLKSISSEAVAIMKKDLMNLKYQPKVKHYWEYFSSSVYHIWMT